MSARACVCEGMCLGCTAVVTWSRQWRPECVSSTHKLTEVSHEQLLPECHSFEGEHIDPRGTLVVMSNHLIWLAKLGADLLCL